MRKSILILSSTIAALSAAALNPAELPGLQINCVSANGNYVLTQDMGNNVVIIDVTTGATTVLNATETFVPQPGVGAAISNTGVFVGSTTESGGDPCYYENGKFHTLPLKPTDKNECFSQGISANGKYICGSIGASAISLDASSIMQVPALWTRGDNGEFEVYESLPYPEKDFSGRVPQYATAIAVSDDGKTVVGQLVDYSGGYIQPVLYTKNDEGKWAYTMLMNDVFTPTGDVPEYPGECKPSPDADLYLTDDEAAAYEAAVVNYDEYTSKRPNLEDYLTDEDIEAYAQAYEAWLAEDPETRNPFAPTQQQFMSEDNKAAYDQAVADYWDNYPNYPSKSDFIVEKKAEWDVVTAEYNEYYADWNEKEMAFEDFFWEFADQLPNFVFNSVVLSPDGKQMAQNHSVSSFWSTDTETIPYLIDLTNNTHKAIDNAPYCITTICDDGTIVASSSGGDLAASQSFVAENADSEFMPLEEYIAATNETLGAWMKEHMCHTYTLQEYEEQEDGSWELVDKQYTNKYHTGITYANADHSVFASWSINLWDDADDYNAPYTYAYVLPMDYTTGIESATVGSADIEIIPGKNGEFSVSGNCTSVEIYDLNGRKVFAGQGGGTINSGIGKGIYIIKASDAKGNSKIAKTSF